MAHVFISYSTQNFDFARHLRTLLNAQGFTVWLDQSRLAPSSRWWTEIEDNIERCAALIVIMSPSSRESDWVEREVLYAERLHKPICPVLLEGEVWPRLANLQAADMRAGLDATLPPMLASQLARLVGPVEQPAPDIPLPKRVAPPPGSVKQRPRKRRRLPLPRLPRLRARLLIPLVLLIAAALVVAFDDKIDAWLFGDDPDTPDEHAPYIEILNPKSGSEIMRHIGFDLRAEFGNIPHPMILQFWIGDEIVFDREIGPDNHFEETRIILREPGMVYIRAQIMNGDELVAEDWITIRITD